VKRDSGEDEPNQAHINAQAADIKIADKHFGQPLIIGVPYPLRKAAGQPKGAAANDKQHAKRY